MDKQIILEKLKTIIETYAEDKNVISSLTESSHLLTDLRINSANLIDVFLDIEDQFDIQIEDNVFEKISTVKDAIEIIQQKVENK